MCIRTYNLCEKRTSEPLSQTKTNTCIANYQISNANAIMLTICITLSGKCMLMLATYCLGVSFSIMHITGIPSRLVLLTCLVYCFGRQSVLSTF